MSKESDFQEILENGISFGRGGGPRKEEDKVKTKAKKKKYITGAHGSGSARQKAKYRPYHGSGAMTRSPSPLAWRPDFPGAPREAH